MAGPGWKVWCDRGMSDIMDVGITEFRVYHYQRDNIKESKTSSSQNLLELRVR